MCVLVATFVLQSHCMEVDEQFKAHCRRSFAHGLEIYTMLNNACMGNIEHMKYLHSLGVSYDCTGFAGTTPLIDSARSGTLESVDFLCSQRVHVDHKDVYKRTALFYAIRHKNRAVAHWLLKAGAATNKRDYKKRTLIHVAAKRGDETILESLLNCNKEFLNTHDRYGDTPLTLAARHNVAGSNRGTMRCLLQAGANVDISGRSGRTALLNSILFDEVFVLDLVSACRESEFWKRINIHQESACDIVRWKYDLINVELAQESDDDKLWQEFLEQCRQRAIFESLARSKAVIKKQHVFSYALCRELGK